MADDVISQTQDDTLTSAAAAIDALLKAPEPNDDAPADAEAQPTEDSPQAASQTQAHPDETATQDAPAAPVADTTAPTVKTEPARPSVSSPELETRLAEAAKKTLEAETARNQFVNTLSTLVPQLEAQIRGEFADIKSDADLIGLADPKSPTYNPDRYNAWTAHNLRLNSAKNALAATNAKILEEQTAKVSEWRKGEEAKIAELLPDLKDPAKGPVLARKLKDFALKSGYTEAQLSMASANDFSVIHKAMERDDLAAQLDAARSKAAKAPPVQQPGVTQTSGSKDQKITADYERLTRTGRIEDAAAVFRNLLN